jgi:hypothetical protein
MDHANDESVLGDFSGATFTYGVKSRFFREGGKFFVETDGADGTLGIFEIKYTFGVYPLQQYLIEFPDGRLQTLSIAWDSRPKDQGGQRWFHLYPNESVEWIVSAFMSGPIATACSRGRATREPLTKHDSIGTCSRSARPRAGIETERGANGNI